LTFSLAWAQPDFNGFSRVTEKILAIDCASCALEILYFVEVFSQ
jgi:hypothetical protein